MSTSSQRVSTVSRRQTDKSAKLAGRKRRVELAASLPDRSRSVGGEAPSWGCAPPSWSHHVLHLVPACVENILVEPVFPKRAADEPKLMKTSDGFQFLLASGAPGLTVGEQAPGAGLRAPTGSSCLSGSEIQAVRRPEGRGLVAS